MKNINVCLVGVGNCASALVQGVEFYKTNNSKDAVGVTLDIGGYSVDSIKFVLGFDVNKNKVLKSIEEAIFVEPNCADFLYTPKFLGKVYKGPLMDGLDSAIKDFVPHDDSQTTSDIESLLKEHKVDVMLILLPTGSQDAAEFYAKAAISSGCSIVNGMPADIANHKEIVRLAEENSVCIIGDDIKSQVGATIIHRALMNLFPMRNAFVDRTIQLDWGGDMDFCNLTSNGRYNSGGKRRSKTESVVDGQVNKEDIDIQVSAVDYIPFLKNQKEAYTRIEGRIFGGKKVRIDVNLQVEDAYNSAGILVDALRVIKVAKDRGVGGVLDFASAFFNKRPPTQLNDQIASIKLKDFLQG